MPKGYVCFTTLGRDKYCSEQRYANHEAASEWVSRCVTALQIQANDIKGKPRYPLDDQEPNSTIMNV